MRVKIISKEIIYPDTVLETTTTAVPTQSTQGLLPPEVRLAPWLNEPFSAARRGPQVSLNYLLFQVANFNVGDSHSTSQFRDRLAQLSSVEVDNDF